jgi:hypothetical protein
MLPRGDHGGGGSARYLTNPLTMCGKIFWGIVGQANTSEERGTDGLVRVERAPNGCGLSSTSGCQREGRSREFDRAHLQKATIVPWKDNATIFDALAQGKADLMITDSVETRMQANLHPGVLCPVHPNAPFDHSQLAYWMPRDVIFVAYVNQWLSLLDLTGVHQAILARWLP